MFFLDAPKLFNANEKPNVSTKNEFNRPFITLCSKKKEFFVIEFDEIFLVFRENENVRATVTKSENFQESEKPPVRTIYLDDARTRNPSAATRALIRNLNSSSVQEQLNWDSESLKSERTITERSVYTSFLSNSINSFCYF